MRWACLILLAVAISARAERPNVLLIVSDDLSAGALGCYGSRQASTPNLDRLAADGVRFSRAYCQFPVCGPSRAALMSGLYPQQNGVVGNGSSGKLATTLGGRPTLGEHFKNSGYYTARASKIYHMRVPGDITAGVDGDDHAASWTERFNFQGAEWMTPGTHEHLSNEKLNRDPTKHYNLGFGTAFYVVRADGDGSDQPDYRAASKTIELLQQHQKEPFFIALGLVRPHVPLVAPADDYGPFPVEEMALPPARPNDWDDIPPAGITGSSKARGLAGPETKRKVLAAYSASVTFMDAQVGRVLGALGDLGLRDQTIVVFKSDHGYHLGEHDFWQKMSLHEESARIPLIIDAPGRAAGETAALAEAIDLYPTLCELAGLPVPGHCAGVSLVPVLDDPGATVRDSAYTFRGNGAHLLRTDRWAYLRYRGGEEELYDMDADPRQFTNLIDTAGAAGFAATMRRRADARIAAITDPN